MGAPPGGRRAVRCEWTGVVRWGPDGREVLPAGYVLALVSWAGQPHAYRDGQTACGLRRPAVAAGPNDRWCRCGRCRRLLGLGLPGTDQEGQERP